MPAEVQRVSKKRRLEDESTTRTSFALSERSDKILSGLSRFMDRSAKVCLDELTKFLLESSRVTETLNSIVERARTKSTEETKRRSKVLTVGTKNRLGSACDKHDISRDGLLDALLIESDLCLREYYKRAKALDDELDNFMNKKQDDFVNLRRDPTFTMFDNRTSFGLSLDMYFEDETNKLVFERFYAYLAELGESPPEDS